MSAYCFYPHWWIKDISRTVGPLFKVLVVLKYEPFPCFGETLISETYFVSRYGFLPCCCILTCFSRVGWSDMFVIFCPWFFVFSHKQYLLIYLLHKFPSLNKFLKVLQHFSFISQHCITMSSQHCSNRIQRTRPVWTVGNVFSKVWQFVINFSFQFVLITGTML